MLASNSTLATGVHGVPAEGEDIRVMVKTLSEVEALLDAGAIENGHTLVALYWLLRRRDQLRQLWGRLRGKGEPLAPASLAAR